MSFERDLVKYGPDLDFSENRTFCLYCGMELGVVISDDLRVNANACLACDTEWERCYTSWCPSCGPWAGFVHLNRPYYVTFTPYGRLDTAYGTGACDCCLTAVVWSWNRSPDSRHDEPLLKLACFDHNGPMPQLRYVEGKARDMVSYCS